MTICKLAGGTTSRRPSTHQADEPVTLHAGAPRAVLDTPQPPRNEPCRDAATPTSLQGRVSGHRPSVVSSPSLVQVLAGLLACAGVGGVDGATLHFPGSASGPGPASMAQPSKLDTLCAPFVRAPTALGAQLNKMTILWTQVAAGDRPAGQFHVVHESFEDPEVYEVLITALCAQAQLDPDTRLWLHPSNEFREKHGKNYPDLFQLPAADWDMAIASLLHRGPTDEVRPDELELLKTLLRLIGQPGIRPAFFELDPAALLNGNTVLNDLLPGVVVIDADACHSKDHGIRHAPYRKDDKVRLDNSTFIEVLETSRHVALIVARRSLTDESLAVLKKRGQPFAHVRLASDRYATVIWPPGSRRNYELLGGEAAVEAVSGRAEGPGPARTDKAKGQPADEAHSSMTHNLISAGLALGFLGAFYYLGSTVHAAIGARAGSPQGDPPAQGDLRAPVTQVVARPENRRTTRRSAGSKGGGAGHQQTNQQDNELQASTTPVNPVPSVTPARPIELDLDTIASDVAGQLEPKDGRADLLQRLGRRIGELIGAGDHTKRAEAVGILMGIVRYADADVKHSPLSRLLAGLKLTFGLDHMAHLVAAASVAHPLDDRLSRAHVWLDANKDRLEFALNADFSSQSSLGMPGPAQRFRQARAPEETKRRTTAEEARVTATAAMRGQLAALAGRFMVERPAGSEPYARRPSGGDIRIPNEVLKPHLHIGSSFITQRTGKASVTYLVEGDVVHLNRVRAALAQLRPLEHPHHRPLHIFLTYLLALEQDPQAPMPDLSEDPWV